MIKPAALGLFVVCASAISAQTITQCATDEVRRKLLISDPNIVEREAAFNRFNERFVNDHHEKRSTPYIIPVVFHIIHDYGAENISDEQVYDAIARMNEDYSKTNPDFSETVPEFTGIAADCEIQFRLAQRTLSGGCTNGIERIPSLRTYEGNDAAKLDGWQSGFYLNIWTVKDLQNGAAAYAYYPTSISDFLRPYDGVICRYDYVGSIGAAGEYSSHTLSHEVGHYLNLSHTWGNTNDPGVECGDDQVPDTPVTEGWPTCNLAGATCLNPIDNVQNFMEYSYCSTMFTEGQKNRMYAALNSEDADRNNLWTPENLALTGTNDGYVAGLCAPVSDFYASTRFACASEDITFYDVSWGGEADSRSWAFEGGSPATSTELNPVVTFSEPGWHKVTLTTTNASGSNESAIDQYIFISGETATLDETYFGNFNEESEVDANWVSYNKYPDERFWDWKPTNGYWAGGCMWLNSRFGPNGETDALISPTFDLSSGLANNIYFKYSTTTYAESEDDHDMALKLYYSTNCGRTWYYMSQLTTDDWYFSYGGGGNFAPHNPDQWGSASFNLPEAAKSENVKFKLEFVYNSFVNNVYIDDFNFESGVLGIPGEKGISSVNVWPNPAGEHQQVQLSYAIEHEGEVTISLHDLAGKTLFSVDAGTQAAGDHSFEFQPADHQLSGGCYLISVEVNGNRLNRNIVVF